MGCILKGFIYVKDTHLLAYRFESNYESQLKQANKDLTLLCTVLASISNSAENGLGCNPGVLAFLDQVNLANPHLFDLPPSSQMTPLGSGTSFRFEGPSKAHQALGILVERMLLKNDDVFMVDDPFATQLTQAFVSENAGAIDSPTFDLPLPNRRHYEGVFPSCSTSPCRTSGAA